MDEHVYKTINEHRLISPQDLVLVAVSGGPDSIALLHWLWSQKDRLSIQIVCAHFNHGFRGRESDADEEFVAQICKKWGISFYSKKEELGEIVAVGGINSQVLARERRYHYLQELGQDLGAQKIAFAHHQDDQIETILMRFLRGTGTTGLMGMPYKRFLEGELEVVRPFLDIGREEIESYLKRNQIPSRIDSSNFHFNYTRNRIRLELIPALRKYNPDLSSLLPLARMLREDEQYLEGLARAEFARLIALEKEGEAQIRLEDWRNLSLSLQRRIIKLICNYLTMRSDEVPYHHINAIRRLFNKDTPGKVELPWGLEADARYGKGTIRKQKISIYTGFNYEVPIPGSIYIPEDGVLFTCSIIEKVDVENSQCVYFDYDLLTEPFVLRSRQPGDRMAIIGLDGHKKVKDILIDEKIPREKRDHIPLFFAGDELLWIPGIRKSSFGQINEHTRRFLCCEYKEIDEG